MITINQFTNNSLLTFIEDNKIKISIDNTYDKVSIKKGYKMNLIDSNTGSYKGSFMNNYICKKFKSNQKINLTNIETNQILNYCKYFLLSKKEYINYFLKIKKKYDYYCFLRTHYYNNVYDFLLVRGTASNYGYTSRSYDFVPFFIKRKGKK